MDQLTTGNLAKAAHVKVATIRYYERRGLLPEPPRKPGSTHHNGYRLYDAKSVARIQFIKNSQELGFTLNEIEGLLKLRVACDTNCEDVRQLAETKREEVRLKIKNLKKMQKALDNLIGQCDEKRPMSDCPILDALEDS